MLAILALFAVLFPAPLHLTREVTDPLTGSKSVIEEYCHGNRVVSVSGSRTAIAEYDKGVVTTIDFASGTYSVATFDELAKAWRTPQHPLAASPVMRVTPDRRYAVSREAAEVLLGIAYPSAPALQPEQLLSSLRGERGAMASPEYSLPSEQVVELGEGLELRNAVVRVGNELAPAEVLAIPPGARKVEASAVALQRMASELDGRKP